MIKANELRIGNWFSYVSKDKVWTTKFKQVESIHEKGVDIYADSNYDVPCVEVDYSFDYLQPIPLTPEILEKCGFVREKDFDTMVLSIGGGDYQIRWDYERKYLSTGYSHIIVDDRRFPHVKALHQFQNWYYEFTGEELKIEL